ncbi:MAG: DUF6544 family protein [Spirochaetota bacterium]
MKKTKTPFTALGAITALPGLLLSCTTLEGRAQDYVEQLPEPEASSGLITEEDIADLPPIVQRYLRYSRVIGKPRVDSFAFSMEGKIRQSADAEWMDLVSRQYNLLSDPARIYYIRGKWPMTGLDSYMYGEGRMQIKLLNLITIADVSGPEMDVSGLATFLNDLIFCPLGYFSVPVQWRQVGDTQAELSLTNREITVTALLTFDEAGRIVNWETEDRYAEVDGEQLRDRWSTPMDAYDELNGLRIPVSGRGIHDYDDEPYVYVELDRMRNLEWNVRGLSATR